MLIHRKSNYTHSGNYSCLRLFWLLACGAGETLTVLWSDGGDGVLDECDGSDSGHLDGDLKSRLLERFRIIRDRNL